MQHNNTTDDRPDDLQSAALIADTLSASNDLDALRGHTASRALTPAGAGIEATAGPFTRWQPDAKAVTAADIASLAADGTITAYPEGGTDSTARRTLYSLSEARQAYGLPPERSKSTPVFIDTATPAEDDDQPAEHPVSPSGAAIQLNVPEQTVKDLVAGGQVENQTLKDSTAPDIDRYKAPTVLVSEVQAVVERINGGQRPADLATPRGAAYEVGQGLTAAEVTAAIERAELTDYADQIAMTGKGPDGKATTEYAAAGGPKVSIAAVREWHATRQ